MGIPVSGLHDLVLAFLAQGSDTQEVTLGDLAKKIVPLLKRLGAVAGDDGFGEAVPHWLLSAIEELHRRRYLTLVPNGDLPNARLRLERLGRYMAQLVECDALKPPQADTHSAE